MDQEFATAPGLPQRQAEKVRAKEAAKAAKEKKSGKFFYTERDGKLLKITAKKNGAHSEFIMKKPKPGKDNYELQNSMYVTAISKFKKDGEYVGADSYDEKISKMIFEATL